MPHARGTFDVKSSPLPLSDLAQGSMLGRRSIDKQLRGELEGTSKGEMLSTGTPVQGSAGYVAIEHVTGTLAGRAGSFTLQHHATMTRGVGQLEIIVVPDSGTDALTGLSGTMKIIIAADGKHSYEFEYSIG